MYIYFIYDILKYENVNAIEINKTFLIFVKILKYILSNI